MRVRRQGIALILVLVAASSVFALAMQGALSSRLGAVETASVLRQFQGELRARSAATIVFAGLLHGRSVAPDLEEAGGGVGNQQDNDSPTPLTESDIELPAFLKRMLEESGANLEEAARDALITDSTRSALDGGGFGATVPPQIDLTEAIELGLPMAPIELTVDGWYCRVFLSDGAGGLNINMADEAQLLRYFNAIDVPMPIDRALASQILDWRDKDDFINERGAEREAYDRRGVVHRNGAFKTLTELRYLPALTQTLFERMQDDLCVSSDGRIHVPSASAAVLFSTGLLRPGQIDQIMALRDRGPVSREAVQEIVDFDDAQLAERFRAEPSSVIRLRVEVFLPEANLEHVAIPLVYEGAAVVGKHGLREIGLRVRTRGVPGRPMIASGEN